MLKANSIPDDLALETRIRRKLDLYVLLPLILLCSIDFLEKGNIGYASIAGLVQDLNLHGTQFNNVLAVYFSTFVISSILITNLLKKLKPNRVLGFLAGAWGIIITLAGLLVKNYAGLIAIRVVLGFLDGGLFPAVTFYLSCMYKRYELQSRIGVFLAVSTIASLFAGLFAAAILNMDGLGKLAGWRWIFIIEGIILTVVAGIVVCILPASPSSAWFLSKEEREYATLRLQQDSGTEEEEAFEWREFRRGAFDVQTWLTGISSFLNTATLNAVQYFMPTIIVGLGYSGAQAQLLSVPTYISCVVLAAFAGILGDRLKLRGPLALCLIPISMMGYIILLTGKTIRAKYVGACFVAGGTFASIAPLSTVVANNSSGYYKRATAIAFQSMIGSVGGIAGTYLYTADQAPGYIRGHVISLALIVASWILIATNILYCIWENKARREGRRHNNIEKYQALVNAMKTKAPIGDRSPDFTFVI